MIRYNDTERFPKIITNITPPQQETYTARTTEALAQVGWTTVALDAKSIQADAKTLQENFAKHLRPGTDVFSTSFLWNYIENLILAELAPKDERGKKATELIEIFKHDSPLKAFDGPSLARNLVIMDQHWEQLCGKKSILILKHLETLKRGNKFDEKLQYHLNPLINLGRSGSAMPSPRFLTSEKRLAYYFCHGLSGDAILEGHDYHEFDAHKHGFEK